MLSVLASLVSSYVSTIRSNNIPCIESAVLSMASMENSRAVEEALVVYKDTFLDNVTMPTETDKDISNTHSTALQRAIEHFLQKAIFDTDHEYQEALNVSNFSAFAFA